MGETTYEWQFRCKKCGFTKPLKDAGGVRVGAGSKRVLGWCPTCKWLRWLVLESVEVPVERPDHEKA